jgi:hypothetical protein
VQLGTLIQQGKNAEQAAWMRNFERDGGKMQMIGREDL